MRTLNEIKAAMDDLRIQIADVNKEIIQKCNSGEDYKQEFFAQNNLHKQIETLEWVLADY